MKFRSSILLALPLAFGCRNPAPGYVPQREAAVEPVKAKVESLDEIMPLDVGNAWTYAFEAHTTRGKTNLGDNEGTLSYRVTKRDGGQALLVLEQEGKLLEQQDWQSSSRGLFMRSGGPNRTAFSPPQPLAQLPLDAGRTFSWSGTGPRPDGQIGAARLEGIVREPETVDIVKSRMSAIPVATHITFGKTVSDNVSWYRPGIGLVRVRQETKDAATGRREVLLLTLSNYTVKSKP